MAPSMCFRYNTPFTPATSHTALPSRRDRPQVYLRHANAVKGLLIESLRDSSIRLAVILKKAPLRPKPSPSSRDGRCCSATASARRDRRVGAFEVQVNGHG